MRQKERQRQWWWWQWWWSCELCECVCVYVCACVWVNLFVCGAKWINGLIEKFVLTTRVSLCAVVAVDKLSDYLQSCHTDPTATLFKYLCMCDAPIAGIFDFDTFFEHFEIKEISISCCPMNYWSNRRHSKSANQRERQGGRDESLPETSFLGNWQGAVYPADINVFVVFVGFVPLGH